MKTMHRLFLTLISLAITQLESEAVVPSPDGGYPNFTTAEGTNALLHLTSGVANTAVGWYSLFSAGAGSYNTGVGAGTLTLNTADENTATGAGALFSNTAGTFNTATGTFALLSNTVGESNTAIGGEALEHNTSGGGNTAVGAGALLQNTMGLNNVAVGINALSSNTVGNANTAVGEQALAMNTIGGDSSGEGEGELGANTAVGAAALLGNTTGSSNTGVGVGTLESAGNSNFSTAVGFRALQGSTAGPNDAFGYKALGNDTIGDGNTAVGDLALYNNTTGNFNVALGNSAGLLQTTGSSNIYIGAFIQGTAGETNTCYIASIFGQTSAIGLPVLINSNHKLGTTTSSIRFKEDIKSMGQKSEALFLLKPVSFHYKKQIDPAGTSQLGLVAEDVEKVNPDLVVRDKEGKPYSVRYDQVNAMLLNEFLKEHRAFQEEQGKVERLEKQVAALTEGLQKVSAQIESNKPAAQTIMN